MKFKLVAAGLLLFSVYGQAQNGVTAYPFAGGELIEYKLNYGWFSIGKGSFHLFANPDCSSGDDCLDVTIKGASSGFLNVFTKVNDEWGAQVRPEDLLPKFTYRKIEEGRYRHDEKVYFDYAEKSIRVETFKAHRDSIPRPPKFYDLEGEEVFDMISGLLKVRTLPLGTYNAGDTLTLKGFFEDTFYDFQIVHLGKDKIKTKMGKIMTHKLRPIMPDNSTFDGKNALMIWISDDDRQMPVKVTANMFIGKASCEIVSYKMLGQEKLSD